MEWLLVIIILFLWRICAHIIQINETMKNIEFMMITTNPYIGTEYDPTQDNS